MQFGFGSTLVVVQKSHNPPVDLRHKKPAVEFLLRYSEGCRNCFVGVELLYDGSDHPRLDNTLVGERNRGSANGCYRGGILSSAGRAMAQLMFEPP